MHIRTRRHGPSEESLLSTWQAVRATRAEERAIAEAARALTAERQALAEAERATAAEQRATATLAEVAAERDAKELARREAESISTFLIEVFQRPDPARDGRSITVAETLDKAVQRLEADLAAQPEQRAQLLATLAST